MTRHPRQIARFFGLLTALSALGCQSSKGTTNAETVPSSDQTGVEATTSRDRARASERRAASPTKIRVVNDTSQPLVFPATFGDHEPFGIARLAGPPDPTANLSRCRGECGSPPCPEVARPENREVTLQPGQRHEYDWHGRLQRHDKHRTTGACCVTFDPPLGRHVFVACTVDHRCGRVEATLPTDKPITIPMSAVAKATSCDTVPMDVAGRVARGFTTKLRAMLRDRPVASCPAKPQCVAPGELEAQLGRARSRDCSVFIIPRGPELEVRAFLPLKPSHVGGESYARFMDPDFTRVFRVQYEQ
jgi:hypothetical protein